MPTKKFKTYFSHDKNYNTLNNYNKEKYYKKIIKIPLNLNLTCPNRDGTIGNGGCLFCSSTGSGDFTFSNLKLKEQFEKQVKLLETKWPNSYYIAYFQANTNTYGSFSQLKKQYESILDVSKKLVGLSISTRPDSITSEMFSYLAELNKKIPITVELGLQSANEKTMDLLNRHQKNRDFINTTKKLNKLGIKVVAHIINGLPNETKQDMLNTILFLNNLPIFGIKIHVLNILKSSPLGKIYLQKPFRTISRNDFIKITVMQLRHIRPDIIILRITGDGKKEDLIEPLWILKKFTVLNDIDKYMRKYNYFQGDLYKK